MRLVVPVLLILGLAACAPVATGPSQAPSVDAAACAANGGTVKPICRMQRPACIFVHRDAGKACTDSEQCEGRCLAVEGERPEPGQPAAGICEADNDVCGCATEIIGGKAGATLCVD